MLEHSPYCERDLRFPEELETHDKIGDHLIKLKKEHMIHEYVGAAHPFGVVGCDGYNFPYAFSIQILSLLQDEYISLHQFIKLLRPVDLSYVLLPQTL